MPATQTNGFGPLQHSPHRIRQHDCLLDRHGRLIYLDAATAWRLGCCVGTSIGRTPAEAGLPPSLVEALARGLQEVARGGRAWHGRCTLPGPDGECQFCCTVKPAPQDSGLVTVDLHEGAAGDTAALFDVLVNTAPLAVSVFHAADGRLLFANHHWEALLGMSVATLRQRRWADLLYTPDEARTLVARLHRSGVLRDAELELRHADGHAVPVLASARITDFHHEPALLFTCCDLSRQKRLETLAHRDPLTGLPNRNLLVERMESALARADRHGRMVGVLFADLDNFKGINDRWGHAFGDMLLRGVAGRLRNALRGSDSALRLGGDEFVVILEDLARPHHAERAATKILNAMNAPLALGGATIQVAASLGIALYPGDARSSATLLERADAAMYAAKHAGGRRWLRYRPETAADDGYREAGTAAAEHALEALPEHAN